MYAHLCILSKSLALLPYPVLFALMVLTLTLSHDFFYFFLCIVFVFGCFFTFTSFTSRFVFACSSPAMLPEPSPPCNVHHRQINHDRNRSSRLSHPHLSHHSGEDPTLLGVCWGMMCDEFNIGIHIGMYTYLQSRCSPRSMSNMRRVFISHSILTL